MSDRIAKAVIFLSLCLLGASASDLFANTVKGKFVCQQNNTCTGSEAGYITGTNPPQSCTCNLNHGTVSYCVYTGDPIDDCSVTDNPDPSNQCTGTVNGNPGINCYKNYPKCPVT